MGITLNKAIQSGSRKGRRNYPIDFKKQLAIAACVPGVSVARLALDNGINANMLHKWRRTHLAGEIGVREARSSTFVEVHIAPAVNAASPVPVPVPVPQSGQHRAHVIAPKATREPRQAVLPGVIGISLATVTLRLEGMVDPATLAQVLRHFGARQSSCPV